MDKSRMMMIIIIALLVLLLGVVVGVGVWLIRIPGSGVEDWDRQQPPELSVILTPRDLEIFTLEPMTTNLALGSDGRSNHVVATLVIGINAHETVDAKELEEFLADFERKLPVVRSIALEVFGSLLASDVRSVEGRANAAEIIKLNLQETFNSNLIVSVFYSDWNLVEGR